MKLAGLHHVTMITGDAQRNVDFHAGTLGLRLVKQTVNFDAPDTLHLYFGDELGTPGSILTWFAFPGAAAGRPGAGSIHTIELGVASPAALEFCRRRLEQGTAGAVSAGAVSAGAVSEAQDALAFTDPDGLRFELMVSAPGSTDPPLRAAHPEIPPEHAITGIVGARAYSWPAAMEQGRVSESLGFQHLGGGRYRLDGERRSFRWTLEPPPAPPTRQGAGSVHHIAWASRDEDHLDWRDTVRSAGVAVTDVRDREYFRSIYFREPGGVLFEIATISPGFGVDEPPDHLGEQLCIPRLHAHRRQEIEQTVEPVLNPRASLRKAAP